jgi:quercetin dioxygenase-like cupin family protein
MGNFKLFYFGVALCLASCGNQESAETIQSTDTASIQSAAEDTFNYDAGKDGMLVAPGITRKLGDTLGIKMYEVTAKPGDSIPLHTHPDHTFYVIQGGKAAIYLGNDRQEWELKPGMGFVNGPVSDAAKNIGKTTIKFLVVDIYRPRSKR